MADEKKRSERMYGKGPRIEGAPEQGDDNKSGKMAKATKEAEKTAGAPKSEATMNKGGDAEGDVMAGTDGIPTVHHEQAAERTEMHHRHMREHADMHHRHEREHLMRVTGHHPEKMKAMHDRHEDEHRTMHTRHEKEQREMHERHEEMKSGPTGGISEKDAGKGGTEPGGEKK